MHIEDADWKIFILLGSGEEKEVWVLQNPRAFLVHPGPKIPSMKSLSVGSNLHSDMRWLHNLEAMT